MPEISRFYGIIIRIYPGESAASFSCRVCGARSVYRNRRWKVLYGYIPSTAPQLVRTWLQEHNEELRELWALTVESRPLHKIAPLE